MPQRLRLVFAFVILALLGGQQAGYVHLYSHAGKAPWRGTVTAAPANDDHDVAHHPCLRCLALAALDAWTPSQPVAALTLAHALDACDYLARGVVPLLLYGGNSRAPPARI